MEQDQSGADGQAHRGKCGSAADCEGANVSTSSSSHSSCHSLIFSRDSQHGRCNRMSDQMRGDADFICSHEIDTKKHRDASKIERGQKLVFYQENPTQHWGPAIRAKSFQPAKASKNGPEKAVESESIGVTETKQEVSISDDTGATDGAKRKEVEGTEGGAEMKRQKVDMAEEGAVNV